MTNFNKKANIHDDACTVNANEKQSAKAGGYYTERHTYKCTNENINNIALQQPAVNFRDGFGWTCNIDSDSKLRKSKLTNKNNKEQFKGFPQPSIPYRGSGIRQNDIDKESTLIHSSNTRKVKSENISSGKGTYPERFFKLHEHSNPQKVSSVIPPFSRVGQPTRDTFRKKCTK